jgi:hypothetical protein
MISNQTVINILNNQITSLQTNQSISNRNISSLISALQSFVEALQNNNGDSVVASPSSPVLPVEKIE